MLLTLISKRKLALIAKNTLFVIIKSLEHQKNVTTGRVPYLGLELTMHVLKSQIHLARQSLYSQLTGGN
jgi:hypothetical protein